MTIDLNCDMGESFGDWTMGNDAALMPFISSANIACGFHAGDPVVMRKTVRLALRYGGAVGAHPGLPDLQGFGRRNMHFSPEEAYAFTLYQIGALQTITASEGGELRHVKPHGALYNMAAKDRSLADAIAEAVRATNPRLILFGLSGSALIAAGKDKGLHTCNEVFADRSYQPDGSLTPRTQPGALIKDTEQAVQQALQMVQRQQVVSANGATVPLNPETICLHGDGAHALEFAQAIHTAFRQKGIVVKAP
jgi:UPF0271 protein